MAAAPNKTRFAALPLRAIGDDRLSGLHLRVLACIAWHDRMSSVTKKGQGAWASHETMAIRVGCDYTRFSSAVTALAKLGYITRERHHLDRRKHVYHVVYDDENTLPDGKPNAEADAPDTLQDGKPSPETTLRNGKQDAKSSLPTFSETLSKSDSSHSQYISLSDVRYSAEAAKDIPLSGASEMRALSKGSNGKTVNAELARFERAFKAEPANLDLDGWRTYLEGVMQDHVGDDVVITSHAERLLIDIDNYLDGCAY